MNLIDAIILGLTQGLTEFIPVSSSGHLILVGHWLGIRQNLFAFDVALDIGTLLALLVYFARDFWQLFLSLFRRGELTRLAWYLVLATIPGAAAGMALESIISTRFQSDLLVAVNLIWVALVMLYVDRVGSKRRDLETMTMADSLVIGLAQAIALVPGVSRSGITISAGLAEGLDRVSATKFSFWLSAPIIAGATGKVMLQHQTIAALQSQPTLWLAGIVAAAISGYVAIGFLLRYLVRHSLAPFALYRLVVGAVIIYLGVHK